MVRKLKGNLIARTLRKWILEIFMLLLSLFVVGPIFYTVISSFKTNEEVNRPLSMPSGLYLDNYKAAFETAHILRLYLNSMIVAAATIIFVVALGAFASYSLGRRKEKIFNYMYLFFLSGLMVPYQAGMIPLFRLIKTLGLYNNLCALILIQLGTWLPMSILIYTGFIKTIPRELDESAVIDGCGLIRTFVNIVFPLLKPATVSVIVSISVFIWNDFMNPLLFIQSAERKTIPIGIYSFMGVHTVLYGPIFAIVVLSILPPAAAFLGVQRYFYKGMMAGAVKG